MTAKKTIIPTVKPVKEVAEGLTPDDFMVPNEEEAQEDGIAELRLPPIHHVKPPKMQHTSTKIRWYLGLGYTVKEVSSHLGVRYQQVRNVGVNAPKRAAREDVPPYIIELFDIEDDLEAMESHALEREMAAQRQQDKDKRAAMKRARKKLDNG